MTDGINMMVQDTNNVAEENKSNMPEDNSKVVEEKDMMVEKKREAEEKRIRITEKKMVAAERKYKKEKAGQDKRDSEEVDQVCELISECIDRYMTKKETAHYLYTSHLVPPACTERSWMTLKEANEEFFGAYDFMLKLCEQIDHFNKLLNDMVRPFLNDGASVSPNCDASGTQSTVDSLGCGTHLASQMFHADFPQNLSDYELLEVLRNDSCGSRIFADDMVHVYQSRSQETNLDNYNLHQLESQGNYAGVTCLITDMVNCNVCNYPPQSGGQEIDADIPNGNRSIHVDNNGMLCPP